MKADPDLSAWITSRAIEDVECVVPDISGIARGKILPGGKFIDAYASHGLRIPEIVFMQTVTGDYPDEDNVSDEAVPDIHLEPDPASVRIVPWYEEATAIVICDAVYDDGRPVDISPRHVLRRIIELYAEKGWRPIVAPELEFFFVKVNTNPDLPLERPVGMSGREESGRQAYGIEAANEFDPVTEDIYKYCEAMNIDIDTLAHEAGAAQFEINFNHGDPLDLADQVFLFKRAVRQAALRHDVYATFMAKPHEDEPGSSMHIHQSVVDAKTGRNLFATRSGKNTALFNHHIGGLQKHMVAAMPMFAPNVNSYRRLVPDLDAPINTHWGHDNRTVGLRVPHSGPSNRRVENRVSGADANPYLAIAASLACGYVGMVDKIKPGKPVEGSAYRYAHGLPQHLSDALNRLNHAKPLKHALGERFVQALATVKNHEIGQYQKVISSWERENLLLNV